MIPKNFADISIPEPVLGITSIIALILGFLFILLAGSCIKRSKPWRSGLYGLFSLLFLSATAIGLLSISNIHTYQRLSHEATVAEIHLSRLEPQFYKAELQLQASKYSQEFEIHGDEWQLGARIIKWKPPLTIIGFDSLYRLDRIQGRYHDIAQERSAPRSVFSLNPDSSLDLWSVLHKYRRWLPWVDAFYGSAIYLPMADESSFEIKVTQSGLIARASNAAATNAVGEWQ